MKISNFKPTLIFGGILLFFGGCRSASEIVNLTDSDEGSMSSVSSGSIKDIKILGETEFNKNFLFQKNTKAAFDFIAKMSDTHTRVVGENLKMVEPGPVESANTLVSDFQKGKIQVEATHQILFKTEEQAAQYSFDIVETSQRIHDFNKGMKTSGIFSDYQAILTRGEFINLTLYTDSFQKPELALQDLGYSSNEINGAFAASGLKEPGFILPVSGTAKTTVLSLTTTLSNTTSFKTANNDSLTQTSKTTGETLNSATNTETQASSSRTISVSGATPTPVGFSTSTTVRNISVRGDEAFTNNIRIAMGEILSKKPEMIDTIFNSLTALSQGSDYSSQLLSGAASSAALGLGFQKNFLTQTQNGTNPTNSVNDALKIALAGTLARLATLVDNRNKGITQPGSILAETLGWIAQNEIIDTLSLPVLKVDIMRTLQEAPYNFKQEDIQNTLKANGISL